MKSKSEVRSEREIYGKGFINMRRTYQSKGIGGLALRKLDTGIRTNLRAVRGGLANERKSVGPPALTKRKALSKNKVREKGKRKTDYF